MSFRPVLLISTVLVFSLLQLFQDAGAQSEIDEAHKARSLAVLNYLTGWSLDSAGYHPAVYMLLENISGRDLSGVTIKMQGKFTDIHTLEPSTAKVEIRRALKPHQQFPVALVAPREFELPRDTNFWPVMECKAMMRVGSVGDEGTEYLLVTKIDSTTATQDDAFQKLNELTSYNHAASTARYPAGGSASSGSKPLLAKADKLKPQVQALKAPQAASAGVGDSDFFNAKSIPGLGEDFYNFEKSFGLPVLTDARKKDFTWAKFRERGGAEVIVASRERSGKADLVAFVLPRRFVKNEQNLIEQGKRFCGAARTLKFSAPSKSVRYLPSGRVEFVNASAAGAKIECMCLPESSGQGGAYLVTVSRLSQDAHGFLHQQQSGNEVLKDLPLGE